MSGSVEAHLTGLSSLFKAIVKTLKTMRAPKMAAPRALTTGTTPPKNKVPGLAPKSKKDPAKVAQQMQVLKEEPHDEAEASSPDSSDDEKKKEFADKLKKAIERSLV